MRKYLRSLSGLLAFDATARHSSLTRAAEELGRTQSAVSQQVKALEEQLGLSLFVRRPRKISLTPAGRELAKSVDKALNVVDGKVGELVNARDSNVVRMTTYHSLAIHWLVPRLSDFTAKHPDVEIQINTDDRVQDFALEGFDIAIRTGRADSVPVSALSLRSEQLIAVYSSELEANAEISVGDIFDYPLLGYGNGENWQKWLKENSLDSSNITFAQTYSHSGLLAQAAAVGAGVGVTTLTVAAEAIFSGKLKCVKAKPAKSFRDIYLLTAKEDPSEAVKLFMDWLVEEMAAMERRLQSYLG